MIMYLFSPVTLHKSKAKMIFGPSIGHLLFTSAMETDRAVVNIPDSN